MTAEPQRSTGGLGRGLAALIPQREDASGAVELPIAAIARNPYQPRQAMEQVALGDLATSIAEHGVLQPILVTRTAAGYRLIAGERRLRAAEMAGLERIPAVVRTATESEQLAWALIENLQRANLNAIEEARAFQRLVDDFGLTHEEVAARVGRARSTIANTLRLLELAPAVQGAVESGDITEGHGRALAGLESREQQEMALVMVRRQSLSVRRTEELVRRQRQIVNRTARPAPKAVPPDVERLEQGLRESLGTKVTVTATRKGGRIVVDYYDADDLARIYERVTGSRP